MNYSNVAYKCCINGELSALLTAFQGCIGISPDYCNETGLTFLHVAAANGQDKVVEYLLSNGADVNKDDLLGWTAAMHAVKNDNLKTLVILKKYGADLHKKNKFGVSLLTIAASIGSIETIKYILDHETHLCINNALEKSLHVAALCGHINIIPFLATLCGKFEVVEKNTGLTTLMMAVAGQNQSIVELLLQKDVNINATNFLMQTASDIALSLKFTDIGLLVKNNKRNKLKLNINFERSPFFKEKTPRKLVQCFSPNSESYSNTFCLSPISCSPQNSLENKAVNNFSKLSESFYNSCKNHGRNEFLCVGVRQGSLRQSKSFTDVNYDKCYSPLSSKTYDHYKTWTTDKCIKAARGHELCSRKRSFSDTEISCTSQNSQITCQRTKQWWSSLFRWHQFTKGDCVNTNKTFGFKKIIQKKLKNKCYPAINNDIFKKEDKSTKIQRVPVVHINSPSSLKSINFERLIKEDNLLPLLAQLSQTGHVSSGNIFSTVENLLVNIGFEKYACNFSKHEITIATFLTLVNQDLEEIGVKDEEDQKKLLVVIDFLRNNFKFHSDKNKVMS